MRVDELWYRWGWLICAITAAMIIAIFCQSLELKYLRAKQPQIKPCRCLTISEALFHIEKREMFVDKLQHCKISQRSGIIDSINYHNAILDSTGNKIEY